MVMSGGNTFNIPTLSAVFIPLVKMTMKIQADKNRKYQYLLQTGRRLYSLFIFWYNVGATKCLVMSLEVRYLSIYRRKATLDCSGKLYAYQEKITFLTNVIIILI